MAGYAPEFIPPRKSLSERVTELSDSRISVYMLLSALVIGGALYFLDKLLLN